MRQADLHIHTTASDGTFTPRQAVELAASKGLKAMAITDHDTVRGHAEAMAAGLDCGIEVIPGIEFSTRYGVSVHILGYYVEHMLTLLEGMVNDRDERNEKIAQLMAADGLPVTYQAMKERFGEVIGRPHFGRLLVELGLAESVADAFDNYVGRGKRYYVPRNTIPIEAAVQNIADAGGVAVLAHPFQYKKNDAELRELLRICLDHGLKGIECRYTGYSPEQIAYLEGLAEEYHLLKTGGSDFHGDNKPTYQMGWGFEGEVDVPYDWVEQVKEAANG